MDSNTVKQFLAKLDPSQDGHWTSQGLPRMDVLVSFGLTIERRELNELVPGFNRAAASELVASNPPAPETAQANAADTPDPLGFFHHAMARSKRREAAIECLTKGGFTLKDLEPVRSRLDIRTAQRNRQALRGHV